MRRTAWALLGALLLLTAAGLAADDQPRVGPPPPRNEARTLQPSPAHVWLPGYWKWAGINYEWAEGRWAKGKKGKVWVPGTWAADRRPLDLEGRQVGQARKGQAGLRKAQEGPKRQEGQVAGLLF